MAGDGHPPGLIRQPEGIVDGRGSPLWAVTSLDVSIESNSSFGLTQKARSHSSASSHGEIFSHVRRAP